MDGWMDGWVSKWACGSVGKYMDGGWMNVAGLETVREVCELKVVLLTLGIFQQNPSRSKGEAVLYEDNISEP